MLKITENKTQTYQKANIKLINTDCMEIMAQYPDKYFDLAVVDPPYGIKQGGEKNHTRGKYWKKKYKAFNDTESMNVEYYKEVIRISKNQIFWGANNYISKMPFNSSGWIVWDKQNGNSDFSDCELAYTSFQFGLRKFTWLWNGFQKKKPVNRIHPTEKPKELYDFCYLYAKADKTMKVIDTHGGSFSSAISAYYFGFAEYVGIEIDTDYFNNAVKRFKELTRSQLIEFNEI